MMNTLPCNLVPCTHPYRSLTHLSMEFLRHRHRMLPHHMNITYRLTTTRPKSDLPVARGNFPFAGWGNGHLLCLHVSQKVLPQCSLQLKWWLLQGRTKGEAEQTAASMVCSWHICGMSWKVVVCIRHYWGMTWTYLLNATTISANWSLTWCKTLQEMYHFHLSTFWDTFICDILINPKWHKSLGKTGHFREGQSCTNYGIQTLIWCNSGGNIDSWKA